MDNLVLVYTFGGVIKKRHHGGGGGGGGGGQRIERMGSERDVEWYREV